MDVQQVRHGIGRIDVYGVMRPVSEARSTVNRERAHRPEAARRQSGANEQRARPAVQRGGAAPFEQTRSDGDAGNLIRVQ